MVAVRGVGVNRTIRVGLCIVAALALIGCGASTDAVDAWARRQGGLCAFQQRRVDQITQRLAAACEPIRVGVLDADDLAAFSWPDRRAFVTRGLVAATSDDELAAAIAHELGHLLTDGHLPARAAAAAALQGGSTIRADVEARADRVARGMLAISGMDPDAMRRLLVKLADGAGGQSTRYRAQLRKRIAHLSSADELLGDGDAERQELRLAAPLRDVEVNDAGDEAAFPGQPVGVLLALGTSGLAQQLGGVLRAAHLVGARRGQGTAGGGEGQSKDGNDRAANHERLLSSPP
jgi:hypothetical protein